MAKTVPIKLTSAGYTVLATSIRLILDAHNRREVVRSLLPSLYAGNPRFDAIVFCKECNVPSLIFDDSYKAVW